MGTAFKAAWVFLRCLELIFAAVVIGLNSRYLHLTSDYHVSASGQLIYTQVVAVLSLFITLVFGFPWSGAYYEFPLDFILWVMWIVAFGLQIHLAGGAICNSTWYWRNWGWYWGRPVRPIPVDLTQADVGKNGCSAMQTLWAFSFICGWIFFMSGIAGTYGFANRYRRSTRTTDSTVTDNKVQSVDSGVVGHTGLTNTGNFDTETGEKL